MRSLVFLLRKQFKNTILSLFKQPSRLIIVLVFIALLAMTIAPSLGAVPDGETFRDISELYAAIFVVFTGFFLLMANNGFGSGSSMYSMADVNILFETPIRSKIILFYGLLRQIGTAALVCFFVLYQYSTLYMLYGVSYGFVLLMLLCFAVVIMCGQLTAMLIYSKTSYDDDKKRKWRIGFYGLFILLIGAVAAKIFMPSDIPMLENAVGVLNSTAVSFFPIAGWMRVAFQGMAEGQLIPIVLGLGGSIAFIGAIIAIMAKSKTDYYEDVLAATEVAHSAITAKKEGGLQEVVPKNIKVGKTGIGAGSGATAVYYKQKVENRRARVFIVDMMTLIFIVITIAVSLLVNMSNEDGANVEQPGVSVSQTETAGEPDEGGADINTVVIVALAMSIYMQMFSSVMGRFAKELVLPYIYMIPEPPFLKLVNCIRESIPSLLAEGLLLWIPLMFLAKIDPLTVGFLIVSRISFGFIFIAANVFVERFVNGLPKMLTTCLYFLLSIIMIVPGIIAGVFAGTMMSAFLPVIITAIVAIIIINLVLTGLVLFASRNMLTYAELNNT